MSWEPTMNLRFVERGGYVYEGDVVPRVRVLQQQWKSKGTSDRYQVTSSAFEWRDVPLVREAEE